MSGGGEKGSATTKTPGDFLKSIRGRPVVVKLNSGVDYRGHSIFLLSFLLFLLKLLSIIIGFNKQCDASHAWEICLGVLWHDFVWEGKMHVQRKEKGKYLANIGSMPCTGNLPLPFSPLNLGKGWNRTFWVANSMSGNMNLGSGGEEWSWGPCAGNKELDFVSSFKQ